MRVTWSVPLADVRVTEADIDAIVATYRSGWLSMGPRTEAFEAEFAEFTGARHAFAVTNGTAALHLACLAVGLGPGDEVIVPSLTFVASVNAIAYTGATPVFADIAGLDAPWLDPASVAAARTERTKAVMHVPYGGHAGETAALAAWCEREGLMLLEDAAHAVGSPARRPPPRDVRARPAPSRFFSNKNLAVGEGGALTVADDASRRAHPAAALARDDDADLGSPPRPRRLLRRRRARLQLPIDEPRAALAGSRLARIDAENAQRAELDARYRELLEPLGLTCALGPRPGVGRAFHLFCVVLPEDADRAAFRQALADRRIQSSQHYPPAHRFSIHRDKPRTELPVTEAYGDRTVTLPLFAHMTAAQVDEVVEACAAALGAAGLGNAGLAHQRRRAARKRPFESSWLCARYEGRGVLLPARAGGRRGPCRRAAGRRRGRCRPRDP